MAISTIIQNLVFIILLSEYDTTSSGSLVYAISVPRQGVFRPWAALRLGLQAKASG